MSVDLICPECGGIIGAVAADAQGRHPCECFDGRSPPPRSGEQNDSSDTVSLPSESATIPSPPPPMEYVGTDGTQVQEKICVVCGKNVAGHRRVKDSRGYLCLACAKSELEKENAGKIPCAECGRRIKEKGLIQYMGIRICRSCYEDHKESKKKIVRKVASRHYDEHERRNLIILTVAFVILGLIVLVTQLRHH